MVTPPPPAPPPGRGAQAIWGLRPQAPDNGVFTLWGLCPQAPQQLNSLRRLARVDPHHLLGAGCHDLPDGRRAGGRLLGPWPGRAKPALVDLTLLRRRRIGE